MRVIIKLTESYHSTKECTKYLHLSHHLGLRRLSKNTGKIKVIFLPFVGGQSLSFRQLADTLPNNWELWGIDPPGHGWAGGEFITDFTMLANLYFQELHFLWKNDFYLFGHSLGGLFAFRLGQLMEEVKIQPRGIFIGASPVLHRIDEYEYLRRQSEKELIETMISFGGIPENIALQRDFLMYYIKQIQADLPVFLNCKISRTPVIKTPMVVFYSKQDLFVPYENMFEWDIYGENVCFEEVDGGHLFIQSHQQLVAAKIIKFIQYQYQ